ncbi:MAG TPA: BatA domain-containing protein [Lysobacter sp.]|nr:BatA domain-containing protein [Lysobacter sp.]
MNLVWLLPLGLATLAAWVLPLLIHLRRRSEQHRTEFAALRWLQAQARPRKSLRFEEWPLLIVRLLLLAALALLLAQPVLYGSTRPKHWQVFAPEIDSALIDVRDDGTEQRWLAPGFPGIDAADQTGPVPIGSLLRELDATLPADARLTVFVPPQIDGADAEVPILHRPVRWQVMGAAPASPAQQASHVPPRSPLAVRYADKKKTALRYLRASAIAWQATTPATTNKATTPDIATFIAPLPSIDRPLAWLASGPLPERLRRWVESGGTVLVDVDADVAEMEQGASLWRDTEGKVLVRGLALGRGRILQWTRPLTPDAMPLLLEPEFPAQLWHLFAPPVRMPSRIAAADYAPRTGGAAYPEVPRDLQPWLLLVIAALFVVERWLASARRERTSE